MRNPVKEISLLHNISNSKYHFEQKLQTGLSKRFWLHSELENEIGDSISNESKGMFFALGNNFIKKDSTLSITVGYRYVDPDFRSAGAQLGVLIILRAKVIRFIQFTPICL